MNPKDLLLAEIDAALGGKPAALIFDSQFRRFVTGKRDDGWYAGTETSNGYWICTYGCHRQGIRATAYSHKGIPKTERDKLNEVHAKAAEQNEENLAKKRREAAELTRKIWHTADTDCSRCEYLKAKQVAAYGIRWNSRYSHLVIPVFNASNQLTTLQFVANDGTKRFLAGGAKAGGYFVIGDPDCYDLLYIAEGYATAATVRECTGVAVVVAFDANNLGAVTGIFRAKYPGHDIIMAADNDRFTEGNPGVAKARAAALQHGCLLAIPECKEPAGTDYNDLYCLEGQEAVCESLTAAITP